MPAHPWKIVNLRGKEIVAPPDVDVWPDSQLPIRLIQAYSHRWKIVPTTQNLYSRRFFDEMNDAERSRREILNQATKALFKKFRKPTIHQPMFMRVLTRVDATPDLDYPFHILLAYRDLFSGRKRIDLLRRTAINLAILALRRSDPWRDLSSHYSKRSCSRMRTLTRR